jgi:hypothetical protein
MDVQGPPPSTRVERPVMISGALGLMGGAGVDVTYQLSDGFFALDFKYGSRLVRHAGETIRIGANPAIFG